MNRERVRTFVVGFDGEVLGGGIPAGQVVLLRGPTGTMKTSLAYYILYQNALHDAPGVYITLEQSAPSLLEQMASLGLHSTRVSESLPILDLSRGRAQLQELALQQAERRGRKETFETFLLEVLRAKIRDLQSRFGLRLLAIDSWDALAFALDFRERRAQTFEFFDWLRELGVTSFLVTEVNSRNAADTESFDEAFLADAILELSMEPVNDIAFQRRIQCLKVRSANHDPGPFTLLFERERFEVARTIG